MPAVRGQGQWALGYREPLNANEQAKKDSDPLRSSSGSSTSTARPGSTAIDGTRPARPLPLVRALHPARRRHPRRQDRRAGARGARGAVLHAADPGRRRPATAEQLRVIGEISTEYGRDVADVTDRQNVQLHWIRVEDVPAIWDRLDAVGLDTTEACGDCPRVIIGCPLAGVDADEVLDATPVLQQVRERYIGDPAFSNLPRKFKTSISGCSVHCTNHEINDVAFVGVELPDGRVGYDLWVGGGLSTNPKLGLRLGAFVEPDRVAEVWAGVCGVFRDYGYRRSRMHARLKFLLADWGPEKFREVLETEYLTAPLPDGPPPSAAPVENRDHVGVHTQGTAARTSAPCRAPAAPAALAAAAGRGPRRAVRRQPVATPPSRAWSLLDVPAEHVDTVVDELEAEDLRVRPSRFRRGVWPAPASSSASSRSWRPRPARSTSTPSSRTACPTSTSRCSTSTAAPLCARFQPATSA